MNLIWQIIAVPLGYIMQACYWFANDLLGLPGAAYIIAIFLFALVTKILMFPLSLKQQRSTARMSAFQPLMKELQDKYKNDKDKMNTEMQKLQQEYGISMFSGCLPMLLQFPILFGLVEVIYKPLTYMLHIPADVMAELSTVTARFLQVADPAADRLFETKIIEQLQTNSGMYTSIASNPQFSSSIEKIQNLNMNLGPIKLWETPTLNFNLILLVPLFSVITMLLSSLFSMKASGQSSGKGMLIGMTAMFAFFSFMYPAGFSLYWGFQNLIIIFQSWLLRKMVDPEKIKADFNAQIVAKKKAAKAVKKVKLPDAETGELVEKEIGAAELARLRLQKARELEEERYN